MRAGWRPWVRLFVDDAKAAVGWPMWTVDVKGWRARRAAAGLRWWQRDPVAAARRAAAWRYYVAGWADMGRVLRPGWGRKEEEGKVEEEEELEEGEVVTEDRRRGGRRRGQVAEQEEAPIAGLARALDGRGPSLGVDGVKQMVAERVGVFRDATGAFMRAYYEALRETEDVAAGGAPRP